MDKPAQIALLIDADNATASRIDVILGELSRLGETNVRRAYGNWTKTGLKSWQEVLHENAIRPVQQFDPSKGKNASDIALAVDAVEILHTQRPDAFALVSSDADFTPLVMHLREHGAHVYGFGDAKTPQPFQSACTPIDGPTRFPDLFGNAPPPATAAAGGDEAPEAPPEPEPEPAEAREDAEAPGVTRAEPAPEVAEKDLTPQGRYRGTVTEDPDFEWSCPTRALLKRSSGAAAKPDTTGQEQVATQLVETLGHFGIEAKVIGTITGPHITRYELRLAPGTKVSKVAQLKDDIAYGLAASEIRILAPIPGKQAVGVEVPNHRRRIVHLGDVFQEPAEGLVAAHRVAGQGRGRARHRRGPDQDAPPPRGGHDRLR